MTAVRCGLATLVVAATVGFAQAAPVPAAGGLAGKETTDADARVDDLIRRLKEKTPGPFQADGEVLVALYRIGPGRSGATGMGRVARVASGRHDLGDVAAHLVDVGSVERLGVTGPVPASTVFEVPLVEREGPWRSGLGPRADGLARMGGGLVVTGTRLTLARMPSGDFAWELRTTGVAGFDSSTTWNGKDEDTTRVPRLEARIDHGFAETRTGEVTTIVVPDPTDETGTAWLVYAIEGVGPKKAANTP